MSRFLIGHLRSGGWNNFSLVHFSRCCILIHSFNTKTPFSFLCLCDSYFDDRWDHDWL